MIIGHWVKGLGVFVASVLIVHSGVAWALDSCLTGANLVEGPQSAYEVVDNQERNLIGVEHLPANQYPPIVIIHCADSHGGIDLAAIASKTPPRADLSVGLTPSDHKAASIRSFFDWVFNLSPPRGSSRHLLLSVLRI